MRSSPVKRNEDVIEECKAVLQEEGGESQSSCGVDGSDNLLIFFEGVNLGLLNMFLHHLP